MKIEAATRLRRSINSQVELPREYTEWWKTFLDIDATACTEVLLFLNAARDMQESARRSGKLPTVSEESLRAISEYAGKGNYTYLYRGTALKDEVFEDEPYVLKTTEPTLWSQEQSWAEGFAEESGDVLLKLKFSQKYIFLDLNKIPYELGPVGREPEVFLRPGTYKTTVLSITD